ncbi:lysine N(6)-hydroxylase/L-ornithine N(5)-oxygenase family protein [Pseudomonas sp. GNP013]|uniref:lysine N(6)-hydroxylase/L-ornithine N(5)-oxygenase family protein n=1 Tax=Pseudomonas sp. Leaf59 TaxID=2876556 RepID=UPI001E2D4C6F|nr:SidA/IucD/PvdA family monooxygenase [Pseudomonas sp. Leaf59]
MSVLSAAAVVDMAGIGIGPANLSLAALARPHAGISSAFFERSSEFQWHPGMMVPEARLQVHYLKDLVSLVDPSNPLSFLAYLSKKKQLLSFINANFDQVLRREFNQYYRWACSQLPNLQFNRDVRSVTFENGLFMLKGDTWMQPARNLVLGTGQQPSVPAFAQAHLGDTLFHASQYMTRKRSLKDKRVVVIGGGQTGAEIIQHLLSDTSALPASVTWVSRRWNFAPLDESPFTNELYTPQYSDHFFAQPEAVRQPLLAEQKLASDGISQSLLQSIYRRLYELKHVLHHPCQVRLLPGRELTAVQPRAQHWSLALLHGHSQAREELNADVAVLCTGYAYQMPACLEALEPRIARRNGEYVFNPDYSVQWDGPQGSALYVQNAARSQKGIADPNLGLIPWRCAHIINSVSGQPLYDLDEPEACVQWGASAAFEDVSDGCFDRLAAVAH